MSWLFFYSVLICLINIKFVIPKCEKSYVTICETVPDVRFNQTKKTWTELLIQSEKYDDTPLHRSLSNEELSRDLTNLRWLIVVRQIAEIKRGAFTYLKNLQHLILYDNHLETIQDRTFSRLKNLIKLGLENNHIESLSDKAFLASNIETVDLSYNKLSGLRAGVFRKCHVTELIITHNALSYIQKNSLPDSLKILRLDYNNFGSWPDELDNLKQLEEFTFSHNEVCDIFNFSQMQNLKKLDLSFNQIDSVANHFDTLRNLNYLDLSSNRLKSFAFTPQFVHNMQESFNLFLAYNLLRNLKLQAINNTTIVTVTMSGNPWNCNCLPQMERVFYVPNANVGKTICDKKLFNGKIPVCIATESEICEEDEVSDKDFKIFKNFYQHNICNVFTETDTTIH